VAAGAGRFGHSPFGVAPFGEVTFVDAIPSYYRDGDVGGRLAKLQAAKAGVMDRAFQKVERVLELRDPELARTAEDTRRSIRLGRVVQPEGEVLRRGVDGAVFTGGEFESAAAGFTRSDRGALLRLVTGSRETARIMAVLSETTVLLSPPPRADAGPLRWELLATPELDGVMLEVPDDVSDLAEGWTLSDGSRPYTIRGRWEYPRLQGPHALQLGEGTLTSALLTAPTASFGVQDVGALVHVSYGEDKGVLLRVTYVQSATAVGVKVARTGLDPEDGAVAWFLRPTPRVFLEGGVAPYGAVTSSGVDASVLVPGTTATVQMLSARFTDADVGRWLTVSPPVGATQPPWEARILSVVGPTAVTLASTVFLPAWASVPWELRDAPTAVPESPLVTVNAPDLLTLLARDASLELDTREEVWRRRYYLTSQPTWSGQKGTAEGYEWMAEVTGQNATVQPLYRVRGSYLDLIPTAALIEVRATDAGLFGAAGVLSVLSGRLRLTDPDAAFTPTMVGQSIHVLSAVAAANERFFTIARVVSSTTVEFRPGEHGFAETGVAWALAETFTTLPPSRVRFDEVDGDVVESVRDPAPPPNTFWADGFAWQTGFGTAMPVSVTLVTPAGEYRWTLEATGAGLQAVSAVGWWKLIDGAGVEHWLETVPNGGPTYTFEVRAKEAPSLGSASLEYQCRTEPESDYCPVAVGLLDVYVTVGTGTTERFQRLVSRVTGQVLPAHVRLVARQVVELEAGFELAATIEPEYGPSVLAPLTPYFDEVGGDMVETDTGLHAYGEVDP
jgi:hypothetical protein